MTLYPNLPFALLTTLGLSAGTALAQDSGPVDRFYEALRAADAEAIATVVAPDATIRLADLGFDMTGEEFVESMETWAEVVPTLEMRVKEGEGSTDAMEVRIVCYDFGTNQSMTREISTIENGKIVANEQDEIAESCDGF